MILSLDVGNSQIYGGVYDGEKNRLYFRHTSKARISSDQMGIFLRTVLRENGINPEEITEISFCSVVPDQIHSLIRAAQKYFHVNPFILEAGVKTGLKIKYRNPIEVGSDRIANSIAATHLYPNQNIIVIDMGTATTFCAVTKEKDYLGGVIMAGLNICMEALVAKTAKLPVVEIVQVQNIVSRSTVESIQSGLFWGHLHSMKGIINGIMDEHFSKEERPIVIGTGGLAKLFESAKVFDAIHSDLVLQGLNIALKMNKQ